MILLYPIGHDQAVYSQPWITRVIGVLCLGVFLWMDGVEAERITAVQQTGVAVELRLAAEPDQRISSTLYESVPKSMQVELEGLVDDDAVDADLEFEVAAFVVAFRALPTMRLGYIPAEARPDRAISSLFAHGGWWHLAGNMLLFFLLGGIIECFWQPVAYLALYLGAGLAGVGLYHLTDPSSVIPLVGASGAIAGLISAILFGFGQTRITMGWFAFFRYGTFAMPAWVLAPLWGGLQIFSFVMGTEDGVAYSAHVGGFVFGLGFAFIADRMGWIARDAGGIAELVS